MNISIRTVGSTVLRIVVFSRIEVEILVEISVWGPLMLNNAFIFCKKCLSLFMSVCNTREKTIPST